MKRRRLLWRNLRFHWRGNLAVLLGVAVGTAVLTGALLVGDSLRGSLMDLTERRLGWVDQALVGGRFFREEVARELPAERVAPALLLQGAASIERTGQRRGGVVILGVDDRFWPSDAPAIEKVLWNAAAANLWRDGVGVVLNETLARELGAQVGDEIVLNLQKSTDVPRETLLGRRDSSAVLTNVRLKVAAVAPNDSLAGSFSLNPSPQAPRNAFVPLWLLQERLDLEGRVNALLVGGPGENLQDAFRQRLTVEDWGLFIRDPRSRTQALFKLDRNADDRLQAGEYRDQLAEDVIKEMDRDGDGELTRAEVAAHYRDRHGYVSLESKQMLLEPAAAEAALAAAKELGLTAAPTLVYLANTIQEGNQEIWYSVVAALDPTLPAPLGPMLPPDVEKLADDEIVLADWQASPLPAKEGDDILLKYFAPEEQGGLKVAEARFKLKGKIPLTGAALDPDLTPEFPGITDKLTLDKWDPPFPYENKRVRPRDEAFWKQYRTTPKAYVTLAAGQKLWGSRFGDLTSVRLTPPATGSTVADLRQTADDFKQKLLEKLRPERLGLVFDPIRVHALAASGGGMDFGLLFLGFSFFLIAAALLLVGLLVRLNIDRRAEEIGLLLATGYRTRAVRRLLLTEGILVAALGGLVGLAGAAGYAWLLLDYLASRWPGALDQSFLRLHLTAASMLTGYAAAVAVSVLTIAWAVRVLGRTAPSALLAGQTAGGEAEFGRGRPRWSYRIAIGALVLGVGLIVAGSFAHDHEARAGTFFGGGALLLTAGLAGVWIWMRRSALHMNGKPLADTRWPLAGLGIRNAARQPMRSLLTAGLLASAAFLLVVVEAFRRQPEANYQEVTSGSGGFALLMETELPIYQDLNTEIGREEAGFQDRMQPAFADVRFVALRRRGGDDASCLNLYEPRRPQLFGVPPSLIDRGGFRFAGSEAETPEERANPWLLLRKPQPGGAIPVIGEKNTVQWMLKAGLGSEIEVPDERGGMARLRIVGLLQDSIFQNGLILADGDFLRLHPHQEGYNVFLVAPPPERTDAIAGQLREILARRGVEVTPTAERLGLYLKVENTYLSTFQALGGLGLLLGALGLAVVLLRSVWERRGELALLRALGFRHTALGRLVLAENAFLMTLGLLAGIAAALLAVSPSLAIGEAHVPWPDLAALLILVLAVGLGTGAAALTMTLRAPLVPALRQE